LSNQPLTMIEKGPLRRLWKTLFFSAGKQEGTVKIMQEISLNPFIKKAIEKELT